MLCPTRGRPNFAAESYASFLATKWRDDSQIIYVIDEDDESYNNSDLPTYVVPQTGSMNGALNLTVRRMLDAGYAPDFFGFAGDDHRFRTNGWDQHMTEVLANNGGGFGYANDLFQGINLPTQVIVNSQIVAALGWFGLPGAKHMYLDNTWKYLGEKANCLFFFKDIVIEHMHPAASKSDWDEGYRRVNNDAVYAHDRLIYESWLRDRSELDIETVRAIIGR